MQSFLEEVILHIRNEYDHIEDLVFILPSKRAGTFIKNSIAKTSLKTVFAPEVYSIEGFVEEISGLRYASNTEQLFELYQTYLKSKLNEKETFSSFSKWGQMLLQDFNEIDRYLIDAKALFSNLSAIQEINHWSVQADKTPMIKEYLNFWENLYPLYSSFNGALVEKGLGHQGLVYREAVNQLSHYLKKTSSKTHFFLGFNALNTAESKIIQTILQHSKAEIFWDIDSYFLNDPIHDASHFIRAHQKSWNYFQEHALKGISTIYNTKKNIQITGVPKNISQAKYVGDLLGKLQSEHPDSLKNTAVVLGDETLLNPILHAVPKEIKAVNITMGYPLAKTSIAELFSQFIELHLHKNEKGWFYQQLLPFLAHPYLASLLKKETTQKHVDLATVIKKNNWTYINLSQLKSFTQESCLLQLLFFEEPTDAKTFVKKCLKLISELKTVLQDLDDSLALEYLYRLYTLFNHLSELLQEYHFIKDLKSLQSLYKELLASETVDFQGDPLEGLQIMGMLESRNLDFETVIITSVNEGILPSGKSNNSFVPFDLKTRLGLPTYKEKDAVYTYHFYRLLQRAKNIYIVYNTEPDVLEGGEKSRLITQLLTDTNKAKDITHKIAAPNITPLVQTTDSIEKDTELLERIQKHAENGFSPSSLSNYIRNPLDFYKQNLLGITDTLAVEETIAANTFGTIIHDTLEDLYTTFLGEYLTPEKLSLAKTKIHTTVKSQFVKSYADGTIDSGKNLIAYNVIIRYLENYLDAEILEAKNHKIKMLGVEEKLEVELHISGIDFPVVLKGKLDRIDEKDGVLRIIDYKTGKVASKNVQIVDWNEIIDDYDYSKAFQLLCYAFMYNERKPIEQMESGIISFKNTKAGFLKFATKPNKGSRTKDSFITPETLLLFKKELEKLILEICNPQLPFTEKEV